MAKVNRKYNKGGALKSVSSKNKGLKKLPKSVRNKMGYMKGGGKSVKVNKKYEDGGELTGTAKEDRLNPGYVEGSGEKIYDSSSAAEKAASGATNKVKVYYRAPDGSIQWFILTPKHIAEEEHERLLNKIRQDEKEKAYHEKTYEEMTPEEQKRYDTHMESLRDYNESEREYKHGGKIKKGKKDEMAIIIAIGRPKANKKSGPKAPIRAKRKKRYDNGGIPIPEDTGTDSTVYNSEREAEAAAQKWASDGLPLKGGKCSMRFGYREVVDGVAKKIKYVTYTKDECAEGIIKESQKKKERETAREEWEQSPEGQKSLDKNQASFVRMINEAYEESKRNQ